MNNKNNFPSPLSKKNPKNFQIITKPGVLLTNSAQKKSAADLVTKSQEISSKKTNSSLINKASIIEKNKAAFGKIDYEKLTKSENFSLKKQASTDSLLRKEENQNYGFNQKISESAKKNNLGLKLPKIEQEPRSNQDGRIKSHSLGPKQINTIKKINKQEEELIYKQPTMQLDIKKQKRLSDVGNIPINPEIFYQFDENNLKNSKNIEKYDNKDKIIANFAFKSKAGAMPGNITKTNQDSYIVHPHINQQKDHHFYGVSDGHGVNGHLVSGFVKEMLPKNLERELQYIDPSQVNFYTLLHEVFMKTYKDLLNTSIDINFSGTTTVTLLLVGRTIYSANVGDSRAVLCSLNRKGEWSATPLSKDQKPDDPPEMQRILKNGGRVEAFKDYNGEPIGPARVWLKNENIPGLAMSRSIGDKVAQQAGVICEPEVLKFELKEEDKMIIIASDGVWEFLSNQQVMNLILPYYLKNQPEQACEKVIKESVMWWHKEDEVVDDITILILFLKIKD